MSSSNPLQPDTWLTPEELEAIQNERVPKAYTPGLMLPPAQLKAFREFDAQLTKPVPTNKERKL